MINPDFSDDNFQKVIEALSKKIHTATSEDGYVSLEYSGTGEYHNLKINVNLDEVDKAKLEKDIMDIFTYSKNQISVDFNEIMLSIDKDKEPDSGERRDVS